MPRLHLVVLTTRNETWRLWKQLSKWKYFFRKFSFGTWLSNLHV